MCFIDLQKAYGTANYALQWQVFTRIEVPPQMIAAIRKVHDGMRACVRPDNGVCSDWLEVKQGTTARMRAHPTIVLHLLCSRADRRPPNIQRGYGHPRRAGAPEGTTDVDGTGAGYENTWSMLYADAPA